MRLTASLPNVVNIAAIVPLMDVHDPVPVEVGNRPLTRVEHEWDSEPLCVTIVVDGVDKPGIVAGLGSVPEVGPGMPTVPTLLYKQRELGRSLNQ
jgi:hypothetical protein